jgi:DNA-binding IclR family transcriptional regulator
MGEQPRDGGRFTPTVDVVDVLDVFDEVRPRPAITTRDVADRLGCSQDTARRKLEELVDRGVVGKGDTAGRVVLYWRV